MYSQNKLEDILSMSSKEKKKPHLLIIQYILKISAE